MEIIEALEKGIVTITVGFGDDSFKKYTVTSNRDILLDRGITPRSPEDGDIVVYDLKTREELKEENLQNVVSWVTGFERYISRIEDELDLWAGIKVQSKNECDYDLNCDVEIEQNDLLEDILEGE